MRSGHSPLNSPPPARLAVALDRLIARVAEDHLPHLVADFLPVVNEVSGLLLTHDFRALLLENAEHRFGVGAPGVVLPAGKPAEGSRHTVKLDVDLALDALRPLDL